jgi:hypothetical protein
MKQATILDRSELRRLPVSQLNRVLHATENERRYFQTQLNEGGTSMPSDKIERMFYRIKTLDGYIKNIKNELKDRGNEV